MNLRWARVFVVISIVAACEANANNRDSKKWGLFGDYNFGTQLIGANVGFNATDWLRLHGGFAFPLTTSKFNAQAQGGVQFLVPQWDLSPFIGVASGASSGTLSVNIGVDYTSAEGINVGGGWAQVNTSGASGPFIYLGKYF